MPIGSIRHARPLGGRAHTAQIGEGGQRKKKIGTMNPNPCACVDTHMNMRAGPRAGMRADTRVGICAGTDTLAWAGPHLVHMSMHTSAHMSTHATVHTAADVAMCMSTRILMHMSTRMRAHTSMRAPVHMSAEARLYRDEQDAARRPHFFIFFIWGRRRPAALHRHRRRHAYRAGWRRAGCSERPPSARAFQR